jgi:hypothetical protein
MAARLIVKILGILFLLPLPNLESFNPRLSLANGLDLSIFTDVDMRFTGEKMSDRTKIGSILASRQESLAKAARKIADLLEEFPELESGLQELFTKHENSREIAKKPFVRKYLPPDVSNGDDRHGEDKTPTTNLEKLATFFAAHGNKPIATPEISAASGMNSIVVSNVLWSNRGKKTFEKHDHETNKKIKVWRLRPDEFAKRREGVVKEKE